MKKIKDLKGVSVLNNKEKQVINGGQTLDCVYQKSDGTLQTITHTDGARAVANCNMNSNCKGCFMSGIIAPSGGTM